MDSDKPTWAVLARLAGGMKAQAAEKLAEWNESKKLNDYSLERGCREAYLSWDDAAFRVHLQAVREWCLADHRARMRAGRRWNR